MAEPDAFEEAGIAYAADIAAVSQALGVGEVVAAGFIAALARHDRFLVTSEQLGREH